jgi:Flp pilus assembly pilin Flp
MSALRTLLRNDSGAAGAEFALVVPLFIVLLLGVIDTGRFMYEYNLAEKATQVGARVAIVTNVLSEGLRDEDYAGQDVGGDTIAPGSRIPAGALGTLKCNSAGCSCETDPCPPAGTFDAAAFDVLVARMRNIYPSIADENVEVRYSGSGLGFAGSAASGTGGGAGAPEQMEVSPLITVTLTGVQFQPATFLVFGKAIDMPNFSTTLTAEDASGAYSN